MKNNIRMIVSGILLGAAGGSLAHAAEPAADPVADLTQTHSTIEVGLGNVSDDSFKFGEYNGLQKQGLFGIGEFDLRGGGAYDSTDATRWRFTGKDLGLNTRSGALEYGVQGKFRINVGFEAWRRNRSDSYMTPYLGAGGSTLTLPATWQIPLVPRVSTTAPNARGLLGAVGSSSALVAGLLTAPTAAQLAQSSALIAADVPLFQHYNLYTTRDRYDAGINYLLSSRWDVQLSAKRERKSGTKPMGSVTRTTGGDISTILPDPIDQSTNQLAASINYRSKTDFVTLAYNASSFSNDIASLSWTNWAAPTANMTMSSAPSNQMHQFSLVAGHSFSARTRLVANAAYTRNTQNDNFLTDASTVLVPVTSLNGLVVTKTFNAKLTVRPHDDLRVSLDYKFDERDNRTAVHTFGFYDANEAAGTANINANFAAALGVPATQLRSNTNVNANRPYSRRLSELTGAADFRLSAAQSIKADYEWQRLDRWCDGSWYNCVNAADSKEQTARVEWRSDWRANLNTRLSYVWSKREVGAYDENAFLALVPLANVSPTTATGGASAYSFMLQNGLTGYGPVSGLTTTTGNLALFFPTNSALANATYGNQNRISELLGMRRYNEADRQRDKVRLSLDWQPFDSFSMQTGVDYHRDDYSNSRYGLLDSRDWAANLEGTYTHNENLSVTAFFTHEDQRARSAGNTYTANSTAANVGGFTAISGGCFATIASRNANNKIDPCLNWGTDMRDKTDSYGLSLDRKSLFTSKLDVGAELVVTRARSNNTVSGGNYANNPLAATGAPVGTVAAFYIPASALPTIIADSTELRLNATYALNGASSLRFAYIYADLKSTDYAFDGMQYGGLAGVLPSNETAQRYTVNIFALSYLRRF